MPRGQGHASDSTLMGPCCFSSGLHLTRFMVQQRVEILFIGQLQRLQAFGKLHWDTDPPQKKSMLGNKTPMRSLPFCKRFVFFQLCTHLNLVVLRLYYAVPGLCTRAGGFQRRKL